MNKTEIKQIDKWHQITIEDPASLPGKSIHDSIIIFLKIIEFKYVILNDIEGAGIRG